MFSFPSTPSMQSMDKLETFSSSFTARKFYWQVLQGSVVYNNRLFDFYMVIYTSYRPFGKFVSKCVNVFVRVFVSV